MVTLTQELVRERKMWTAGESFIGELWVVKKRERKNDRDLAGGRSASSSLPPTAKRFPLRLAAVDHFSGVSGRVFQTDMGLADWWVSEVAF